jgi:hypothetical protein
MSFVQRLRMANMFPIQSDLGNARVNVDDDPNGDIMNIINLAKSIRPGRSNGLQTVGNMQRQQPTIGEQVNPPLHFGGVVNGDPGPGRLMNDRAGQETRDIYESYKQPLNKINIAPPSNDEIDYQRYLDNSLKNKVVDSNLQDKEIARTDRNANLEADRKSRESIAKDNIQGRMDVQNDKQSEKAALDKTKVDELKSKQDEAEKLIRQHATDALSVLNDISEQQLDQNGNPLRDKEGNSIEKLKTNTQNITGFSGNIPAFINDLNPNNSSARASIERLMSMLTLDRMQSLRAQSKTGSTGFGSNMNQKEFGTLISAASKLKTMNQSEPGYAKELGRVRTLLQKAAQGKDESTNEQPKIGDMKTFPNGKKGKWDGQGWEQVQ